MGLPRAERKKHSGCGASEGQDRVFPHLQLGQRLAEHAERLQCHRPHALLFHASRVVDRHHNLVLPLGGLGAPQPDLVPPVVGGNKRDHSSHGDPLSRAEVSLEPSLQRGLQDGPELLTERRRQWLGAALQLAPQLHCLLLRPPPPPSFLRLALIQLHGLCFRRQLSCRDVGDIAAARCTLELHVIFSFLRRGGHLAWLIKSLCFLQLLQVPRQSLLPLSCLLLFVHGAGFILFRLAILGDAHSLLVSTRAILTFPQRFQAAFGVGQVKSLLSGGVLLLAHGAVTLISFSQDVQLLQMSLLAALSFCRARLGRLLLVRRGLLRLCRRHLRGAAAGLRGCGGGASALVPG
mmetsp:Transcript_38024/g.90922  ORF Transcript_38024/g.90922 Transcript_38024/m.90922 type:complete len:349 (-) Transcript_38024:1632-2678(-)